MTKAWNIACAIIFLAFGGHWLDTKLHTSIVFTLLGVVLGVVYSVIEARDILNKS